MSYSIPNQCACPCKHFCCEMECFYTVAFNVSARFLFACLICLILSDLLLIGDSRAWKVQGRAHAGLALPLYN